MKKVTNKLLAIVLSFAMILTGFTFVGGAVVASADDGEDVVLENTDNGSTEDGLGSAEDEVQPEAVENDSEETANAELLGDPQTPEEQTDVPESPADPADPADETQWAASDFTFSEDGAAVTGLTDAGKAKVEANPDMVIPEKNGDVTVTAIGDKAFTGEAIKTVKFPETLESIGNQAFQACAELTAIDLPDGVKTVGQAAFSGTNKVASLKLSAQLETIGGGAFQKTTLNGETPAIDKITIPAGVTDIPGNAFGGLMVGEIELHDAVASIGSRAFMNSAIESIEIPASVKTIGSYAFSQQNELARYKLKKVVLNEGLTQIDGNAFAYSAIESFVLPSTVTTLNKTSFANSANTVLIVSTVEDQLNAAGDYAKVVAAGSGHQLIGKDWSVDDFTFDGTTVTGFSATGIAKRPVNTELVIPEANADGEAVTAIGAAGTTGDNCGLFGAKEEKFDKVVLPATVTEIGVNAFRDSGIKEVNFPEGLTSIGNFAFMMNNLSEVILPDTVTTLGNAVFSSNFTLSKVHIPENETLTALPASIFGCSGRGEYMEGLTEITIPSNITSIGDRAFAGNALKSLEIPASVKTIGKYAFAQTPAPKSLTKVVLNEGLESIAADAFDECAASTIILPSTITTLHKNAFKASYDRDKVKLFIDADVSTLPSGVVVSSDYHEVVNLSEGIDELVEQAKELADKATASLALSSSVIEAMSMDTSAYTDDSVAALNEAVEAAKAVIGNSDASAEDLANAKAAVDAASEALAEKAENPMTVTVKTMIVRYSKVRKSKRTVAPITVKNNEGALSFKKVSGSARLTVNATTGKVSAKKGTKKGTYKITVNVTAAGNGNFKASTIKKTVTIRVK